MNHPFTLPSQSQEATRAEGSTRARGNYDRVLAIPAPYVPVAEIGATLPELALRDQNGRPFSFRAADGRAALVTFVYTHCRDEKMCSLASAKFARLQGAIDPAAMRLVEITLDPVRDTPAVLRRYGAAFGARGDRWTFVTGNPRAVDELCTRMGISRRNGPAGEILHNEALAIVDSGGRLAERVEGNAWTPAQALALARRTVHERANPLALLALWLSSGIAAICGGGASGVTTAAAIAIFLLVAGAGALALIRALRVQERPQREP